MRAYHILFLSFILSVSLSLNVYSQETTQTEGQKVEEPLETLPQTPDPLNEISPYTIFDDALLLDGFTQKYSNLSLETLTAMIIDNNLNPYKIAAAVRVFREKYSKTVVANQKKVLLKVLVRRLNRTDSPFVQVETLHTLCSMDRYRYFKGMAPALIQKLDHYNSTVNDLAALALDEIIADGNNRAREARIVFTTLRKILFLSRKRLETVETPGPRLKYKLKLLRWSIKILGTEELQSLPKEVIRLL